MRRRHSSAVEQLFRKSPALCAVLPRVDARYKRAQLSAIRFEGMAAQDRRYGPFPGQPTLTTRKSSHKLVVRSSVSNPKEASTSLPVRASLPRDSCRLTGSLCETKLRQHPELVYDSPVLDGLAVLEPGDVDL